MAPRTFQEAVLALDDERDDATRGMRFRYARERADHAGAMLTWPRLAARVAAIAARLAGLGLGAGEVVAIHSHDQATALIALLAAIRLGAVPTILAPLAGGVAARLVEQFHAVLAVAAARVLVIDRPIADEHVAGRALPSILLVDDAGEADASAAPPLAIAAPEDPCFLQFTSGSTSAPKGVVVTQRMLLANLDAITRVVGWGADQRLVNWLPIYHDMSLVGCYALTVLHRAFGCFFPTTRFGRSPDLWMGLMAEERAAFTAGPNFALAMAVRHAERRPPRDLDLAHVRGVICGSEPIAAPIVRAFHAAYAACGLRDAVIPAYGMAECTLLATARPQRAALRTLVVARSGIERGEVRAPRGDEPSLECVSCGGAGHGVALAVVDSDGARRERAVGEIELSGDGVLTRYHRAPEATARALVERDGRRWLRTGDLGFLVDGELYVCGRAKDLIIHNGVNLYPADIEQALERGLRGRVKIAAVVDLRAAGASGSAGLGVLLEETRDGDAAQLERDAAALVEAYAGLPVAVALALRGAHLPRTTSGKLVRGEIRALLSAELARRAAGGT